MKIFDVAANKNIEAIIRPIEPEDFSAIKKSKQFAFNWSKLQGKKIYKLLTKGGTDILGLMCLEEYDEGWDAIKIELLEVRREHVGEDKLIDKIAGCLIAYACRESIKTGHKGVIFLMPKTKLKQHYQKKYGFIPFGVSLVSDTQNSLKLIKRFL